MTLLDVHQVSPQAAAAVGRRYTDAYIVARTINGFGDTVKALGLAAGVVLTLVSFAVGAKGGLGLAIGIIGAAIAVCIAIVLYVLGTLIAAQGQLLKATLDTAVGSSPFLNNDDRTRVMSLPLQRGSSAVIDGNSWKCVCGQTNESVHGSCMNCGLDRSAA